MDCRDGGKKAVPVMHYVGYAMKASVRKKQHSAMGASTNWLCVFAQAVLRAMDLDPRMDPFTVCLISEEWDGPVAEMLLTRLARAYYFAGGFSIAQAGAIMTSMKLRNLGEKERNEHWAKAVGWVMAKTNYRSIQKAELERRRDLRERQYTKGIAEKKDELKKYKEDLRNMTQVYNTVTADMNEDAWKTVFPEEYALLEELGDYVRECI
jgi:hypothetical protein